MAGTDLIRIVSPAQRAQIADAIVDATRSQGGVDRVALDLSRLNFDPVNPQLETALGRYGEVLGPRYVRLEDTPKSAVAGLLDIREGVPAPGDGVTWTLQFRSADTGEPLTNGLVGAWMTAPAGHAGNPKAAYLTDSFRGYTQLDERGMVKITAHDPQPYEFPEGSGRMMAPHIHGAIKGVDGHVDMPFEQLRVNADDVDAEAYTILVPAGEGRMVLGPWDDHADAVHGATGINKGFILPSEPRPLR